MYGNGQRIVQGPGYVAFLNEMIHEHRIIPLDGRGHVDSKIRTYLGDSRGHWEGNTLVVETTNLRGNTTSIGLNGGNGGQAPRTSDALRLVERFTRLESDLLEWEVLVDDPKDLPAFGRAVAGLLGDPSRASRLGAEARRRVTREFISPCHLISQARLVQRVLAGPDKARTKV